MCDHESREAAMVVIERDHTGTPAVWCDPCIADLVTALNAAGLRTIASCCGHDRVPSNVILADGRALTVIPAGQVREYHEATFAAGLHPWGTHEDNPAPAHVQARRDERQEQLA